MQDLGEISFPIWGTTATVLTTDADRLCVAVDAVRGQIASFDVACSRFRTDSEIERVNGSTGRWVEVMPLLIDAVEVAMRAAALTDGDVDPTVGEALIVLGYDRDFAAVLQSGPSTGGDRPAPGWRLIEIDRTNSRIRVPIRVRLDLGATAKALAADRAAAAAAEVAGCGVLVSLGGDIAVAGAGPAEGWTIGLADSHLDEPEPGQSVRIGDGGLATSSTTVRRWSRGGQTVHHVIDPSTGRPAREVWRTVTVAAATCVDANTASTAAIVRGEFALDWLASLGLPARLVRADGRIVRTATWPRPELAA
jgi:thiamine biosynthesis lipoprotein